MTLHEWTVASALIERDGHLLLVRNVRHGGRQDWSTPGGVIDASDASILEGLAREVNEETGLRITAWAGLAYEVVAVAPDMGWTMRCEVHAVAEYEGELVIDDPDGIVVEADFYAPHHAGALLDDCPPWVREPILEWLAHRARDGGAPVGGTSVAGDGARVSRDEPRRYSYAVQGSRRADLVVTRRDDG